MKKSSLSITMFLLMFFTVSLSAQEFYSESTFRFNFTQPVYSGSFTINLPAHNNMLNISTSQSFFDFNKPIATKQLKSSSGDLLLTNYYGTGMKIAENGTVVFDRHVYIPHNYFLILGTNNNNKRMNIFTQFIW